MINFDKWINEIKAKLFEDIILNGKNNFESYFIKHQDEIYLLSGRSLKEPFLRFDDAIKQQLFFRRLIIPDKDFVRIKHN